MTHIDQCVEALGSLADATAAEYRNGLAVTVQTDRTHNCVDLQIHLGGGQMAAAHLVSPAHIDEIVFDLLAARADLLKLNGGK